MYIAYGIMNGMPAYNTLPYASEIGRSFGTAGGLSFAFMNILQGEQRKRSSRCGSAFNRSGRQAVNDDVTSLREQVAILAPDIIITMNAENWLFPIADNLEESLLGKLTLISPRTSDSIAPHWLHSDSGRSLLIDTFHLSANGKNTEEDFYRPICEAIRCNLGSAGT